MGNKNFIEINGKRYDALTGQLLDSSEQLLKKTTTVIKPVHNGGGVVDGFVRRPKPAQTRVIAQPAVKHPQKSHTLMRNAVKKPTGVIHKVKAEKPVIQKSHLGTSVQRNETAMHTPKSPHITKFESASHRSSVVKTIKPDMQVRQQPQHMQPATPHQTYSEHQHQVAENHSTSSAKIISAALANAHSHEAEEPAGRTPKKRNKLAKKLGVSRRRFSMGSATLAAVLLVGFFAVQNVPNLSMRVAATRAGFEASMPGYQPAGFTFKGPIKYSPGQVSVSFASNTDDRFYEIKQKASNWNSDALLANFVVAEGKQYQTFLDRGRTLYIYDQSNATWVDDGVWYVVEGESDMTTDQLIRIASSI